MFNYGSRQEIMSSIKRMITDDVSPDEVTDELVNSYLYTADIPDPEFGKIRAKGTTTSPEIELGPHVAAIGMRFYTGDMFPPRYQQQIFIAEHGSWNRDTKIGYRITLVRLDRYG